MRHGNLPNAEEAEHVVDAIGVEEMTHVLESAHPPSTVVAEHLVPVVCGEAPVLAILSKVIWRRTGLTVHVEVLRLHPYIATHAAHADGDITLQDDTLLAGMVVNVLHLRLQHKLHVVVEGNLLICFRAGIGECLAIGLIPSLVAFPLREINSACLVTQQTILGVWHQPLFGFVEERLERL